MTRKAMIELIGTRLKRLDKTGQFHPRFIEGVCDIVWQTFAYNFHERNGADPYMYSKKYEDQVVTTDVDGHYYTDLPVELINLPRANSGILRIDKDISRDFVFVPTTDRNFTFMHSQEVYQIGTKIYWYNSKDRIYYGDSMTSVIAAIGVDITLCIPFSSYSMTETLPIPADQGAQFISSVIEIIAGTPPVDERNTNSETA